MKITDANVIICFGFAKLILQNGKFFNLKLNILKIEAKFVYENHKEGINGISIKV